MTDKQYKEDEKGKWLIENGVEMLIEPSQKWKENNIVNENYLLERIREERNKLLAECDWTVLPDSPLSQEQRQVWTEYRKALRDLPDTIDLNNQIFPTKPV